MGFDYNVTATFKPPITYIFTWHALSDACPKCQALNGREYQDQDLFQEVLWDHIWGNIWDLNTDQSLAHPHCRCQVEVRAICDWTQDPEIQKLRMLAPELVIGTSTWEEVIPIGTSISEFRRQIEELKSGFSKLGEEVSTVNTGLRQSIILLSRFGLPSEVAQALGGIQRFRSIGTLLTRGSQFGDATSISGAAIGGMMTLGALTLGTKLFIDVVEADRQRDLQAMYREKQLEFEALKMEMRRQGRP